MDILLYSIQRQTSTWFGVQSIYQDFCSKANKVKTYIHNRHTAI